MFSFENLRVYQLARQLVKDIYLLQNTFPKKERYALGDQIRQGNPITLTESRMTRFIMSLEEAVAKIAALEYIRKELSGEGNFVQ